MTTASEATNFIEINTPNGQHLVRKDHVTAMGFTAPTGIKIYTLDGTTHGIPVTERDAHKIWDELRDMLFQDDVVEV